MGLKEAIIKAEHICARKEYCISEIREKFKNELSENEAEKLIEHLIENQFINNERYTRAYVNEKIRINRWGKIKIRYMLRLKQVDEALINAVLEDVDESLYAENLQKAAQLKIGSKKMASLNPEGKAKLIRHLQSKGYEPSMIYACLGNDNK